jgi:transcriptional regulator with XRE-family HTH domain
VAELAKASGVSGPAIYGIEAGRIANPRTETVKKLEKALGQDLPPETKAELREESTIEGMGEFVDFDPHDPDDRPNASGVYVLYDISERPIYVGEGGNIRKRIRDHEEKFWFKQPIVETAAFVKIDDEALRRKVETVLIRFLKSNAVINKKNVDR